MDKRVIPLALGGLGIGTTEFAIMGLLPDIAGSLNVSIAEAGILISAYALGVVVGAPLLIGYTVKQRPKRVLIWLMILFTIFNGLSIISPNYYFMMGARFLSGLPHGAFFGAGTVVASKLASKGKEARYISYMFSGLTIANLAMVPLVTYVGHTFHWRWYFVIVTLIGLVTLAFIRFWLPDLPAKENANSIQELGFLKNKKPWYVLMITSIGFGGLFCWFSYITPLMTEVAGIQKDNMAYVMVLAGAGMVTGNLFGGYLSDRIGEAKATVMLLIAMLLVLTGIFFLSSFTIIALVLTFICGGLSMSVSAPINIMMIKAAPGAEMMSAAFMQAAFNVANSLGAYLGGIPLTLGLSYNYPSLVGAGMTVAGLIISLRYIYKYNKGPQGLAGLRES
ncbi:MAG: MFS transporter [Citrobacter freundii]|nr:MAG: MFS transporter [Citrobacter freundii]